MTSSLIIMLVGEIRDLETAKVATAAALTGHLVLATLHTNSAPEAVVRPAEMGVDPFPIAPSVLAVQSQRLARRIALLVQAKDVRLSPFTG